MFRTFSSFLYIGEHFLFSDSECSIAPFVPGAKVVSMKKYPNGTVTAEYACLDGLVPVNKTLAVCKGNNGLYEEWDIPRIICVCTYSTLT